METTTPYQVGHYAIDVCRLRVCADRTETAHQESPRKRAEWITKTGHAEIDGNEAVKGGESDALKRAAAKLGVGRNIYNLSGIWASYDLDKQGKPRMPKGHEAKLRQRIAAQWAKDEGAT